MEQLRSMGFSSEIAFEALGRANQDVNRAIEYCLQHDHNHGDYGRSNRNESEGYQGNSSIPAPYYTPRNSSHQSVDAHRDHVYNNDAIKPSVPVTRQLYRSQSSSQFYATRSVSEGTTEQGPPHRMLSRAGSERFNLSSSVSNSGNIFPSGGGYNGIHAPLTHHQDPGYFPPTSVDVYVAPSNTVIPRFSGNGFTQPPYGSGDDSHHMNRQVGNPSSGEIANSWHQSNSDRPNVVMPTPLPSARDQSRRYLPDEPQLTSPRSSNKLASRTLAQSHYNQQLPHQQHHSPLQLKTSSSEPHLNPPASSMAQEKKSDAGVRIARLMQIVNSGATGATNTGASNVGVTKVSKSFSPDNNIYSSSYAPLGGEMGENHQADIKEQLAAPSEREFSGTVENGSIIKANATVDLFGIFGGDTANSSRCHEIQDNWFSSAYSDDKSESVEVHGDAVLVVDSTKKLEPLSDGEIISSYIQNEEEHEELQSIINVATKMTSSLPTVGSDFESCGNILQGPGSALRDVQGINVTAQIDNAIVPVYSPRHIEAPLIPSVDQLETVLRNPSEVHTEISSKQLHLNGRDFVAHDERNVPHHILLQKQSEQAMYSGPQSHHYGLNQFVDSSELQSMAPPIPSDRGQYHYRQQESQQSRSVPPVHPPFPEHHHHPAHSQHSSHAQNSPAKLQIQSMVPLDAIYQASDNPYQFSHPQLPGPSNAAHHLNNFLADQNDSRVPLSSHSAPQTHVTLAVPKLVIDTERLDHGNQDYSRRGFCGGEIGHPDVQNNAFGQELDVSHRAPSPTTIFRKQFSSSNLIPASHGHKKDGALHASIVPLELSNHQIRTKGMYDAIYDQLSDDLAGEDVDDVESISSVNEVYESYTYAGANNTHRHGLSGPSTIGSNLESDGGIVSLSAFVAEDDVSRPSRQFVRGRPIPHTSPSKYDMSASSRNLNSGHDVVARQEVAIQLLTRVESQNKVSDTNQFSRTNSQQSNISNPGIAGASLSRNGSFTAGAKYSTEVLPRSGSGLSTTDECKILSPGKPIIPVETMSAVRRRGLLSFNLEPVMQSESGENTCFAAIISLRQELIAKGKGPQGNRPDVIKLGVFSSSLEARRICEAYVPPMWQEETTSCFLCQSTFALLRRGGHCRNCGYFICSMCSSKSWPSSMVPQYYHNSERVVKICDGCNFLSSKFYECLSNADFDGAQTTFASGNVNAHCPFSFYKSFEYPVHCAAKGGSMPLMRWLLEERFCKLTDEKYNPLKTSDGLTVLAVAAKHGHSDMMQYLIRQHGCSIAEITDLAIALRGLHAALQVPGEMPSLTRKSSWLLTGSSRTNSSVSREDNVQSPNPVTSPVGASGILTSPSSM